jgi:hypothetical protein
MCGCPGYLNAQIQCPSAAYLFAYSSIIETIKSKIPQISIKPKHSLD